MKLVFWEINLTLTKGILIGLQELEFKNDNVYEKDIEIHLGIFKIVLTLVYN